MTLRPCELLDACREIAGALAGRPVQKVVQPDPHTLYLGFPSRWLVLSVDPRLGRVHLAEERLPGTGEAATAFCMLARKLLIGARLASVEAVLGERACQLKFVRSDGERRLMALLYGAGARLLLVDPAGQALGAIGPGRATPAELPQPRTDDQPSRFGTENVSAAIAAHYATAGARSHEDQARSQAVAAARKTVERLRRRERAMLGDLERVYRAADRRRHADLLLAHLAEVPRGASEITLPDDFADGAPIAIALDPSIGPKENVARLYREYQRMARGRAAIEGRLVATRAEKATAEGTLERLASGAQSPPQTPVKLKPSGRNRQPAARPPYREYRSSTGKAILVGRGAEKNDQLTFHVARGGDVWLHTRDVPGAHVIVPLNGPNPIDPETLLDGATLAVHHSPARNEPQADVTWALRKHLRKPRGARPGLVTASSVKTIRVRMEPDRLRRLLATRVED